MKCGNSTPLHHTSHVIDTTEYFCMRKLCPQVRNLLPDLHHLQRRFLFLSEIHDS